VSGPGGASARRPAVSNPGRAEHLLTKPLPFACTQALNAGADLRKIWRMVVTPAIWRRSGQGFDSPHLHPSALGSVFGWGCTGFDRAGKGEQATRKATDVIRANP